MPARLSACLTACFLSRETYGVPMFRLRNNDGVGALYPPVACDAHDKERGNPCTHYSALLAQACQHLWLGVCDDVYRWVDRGRGPLLAFSPAPPPNRT